MRTKLFFILSLSCSLFLKEQLFSQITWQKYTNNPVLSSGVFNGVSAYGIDGSFDSRQAWMPAVIHDNGIYKMLYVGYENYYSRQYSIGYAISEDGINWFPYQKNPVLKRGITGSFEESFIWGGTVLKDTTGYRLYYGGFNSLWKASIGLATSPDGIHWTKYSNNPVLVHGLSTGWDGDAVHSPCVIRDSAGMYQMWYSGTSHDTTAIGYATSSDGYTWVKHISNPIFFTDKSNLWESYLVTDSRVIKIGNTYHMFYFGAPGAYGYQIGYATSTDGLTWHRYLNNPIISLGGSGTWDEATLGMLSVLFEDNQFKMWYSGRMASDYWQIGYATSEYTPLEVKEVKEMPKEFKLYQIYPNPFNPKTIIEYDLVHERQVNITIYNSLGQEVATLVDGQQMAGHYSVVWNAGNFASGIYLCRIKAGEFIGTQKVALVK